MNEKEIKIRTTEPIKLNNRGAKEYLLDMQDVFGFVPTQIIIKKLPEKNNTIVIGAIVPEGNNG